LVIPDGVAMVIASARFGSAAEAAKIAPAIAVIVRYARIVVSLNFSAFIQPNRAENARAVRMFRVLVNAGVVERNVATRITGVSQTPVIFLGLFITPP
jgi:hypothetical protein